MIAPIAYVTTYIQVIFHILKELQGLVNLDFLKCLNDITLLQVIV